MVTRRALGTLALLGAAAALAACGSARAPEGNEQASTTCTSCHGQPPPSGAHAVHAGGAGALGLKLACLNCHTDVQSVGQPGHIVDANGVPLPPPAVVRFDETGSIAGKDATFTASGATCASIYCHGSGLDAAPPPVTVGWNDQTSFACGSCHGVPPPNHSAGLKRVNCITCHGYDATGTPDPTRHVNGKVDLIPNVASCNGCHGDHAATGVIPPGDPRSAPPTDASGSATGKAVGAHQAHLAGLSSLDKQLARCSQCHVVPKTVLDAGHVEGPVLTWGPVANGTAASQPTTPRYEPAAQSCATTYCHGNFTGGTPTTPTWGGTVQCGDCHGLPPASPPHPAISATANCGGCHPGYDALPGDTHGTVNPDTHADGIVEHN